MKLDITIEVPLEPKPKKAVKHRMIKGQVMGFTSGDDRSWMAAFAELAAPRMPKELIDGPIRLDILAVLPRPSRLDKKNVSQMEHWHVQRPDRDNIEKMVHDSLKSFWRDDCIVCCGEAVKVHAAHGERPRTVIRIRSMEGVNPREYARALGLIKPLSSRTLVTE